MRRFVIAILLAGAAASPAFAQDQDHGRWHHDRAQSNNNQSNQRHEQRDQAREQDRTERQDARQERPRFEMRQQPPQVQPQIQPAEQSGRANFDRSQRGDGVSRWNRGGNQQAGETSRWTRDPDQRPGETSRWTRDRTGGWNRSGGDLREGDRAVPGVMQTRNPLVVDGHRRDGNRDQLRNRSRWASGGWNREWRNDRRYDWRRFRDHHRSAFHLGVYFDPFGFGYRSFNIGYNLGPAYYSQQYWIDPQMYSLPYPPPGTQWVRYWNDALLVDVYSGEIVDVIQNFFW